MAFSVIRDLKKSYLARFVSWALVHNFVDLAAVALSRRPAPTGKKRVAFVKLDGVGDYILWTAAFELLKQKYPSPDWERILIGNERFCEFAESDPTFDRNLFVNVARFASSPAYRFGVIREVRGLGIETIVNPRLTREFLWGDSIVRCSGASERIGSRGIENLMSPLQESVSAKWYTELKPAPMPGVHELISNIEFLDGTAERLEIPPVIEDIRSPASELDVEGKYAVIFLGAFSPDKRWPMEKFAISARELAERHGLKIILCGGPGEELLAENFKESFDGNFVSLIGKTTLRELSMVIRKASLTVTNDTAAGHIAVAQRCPVVVITPGNHVGRFFPYPKELLSAGLPQVSVIHEMPCFGCGWTCIYKDLGENEPKPCIAGVEVGAVVHAADRLLGVRAGSKDSH